MKYVMKFDRVNTSFTFHADQIGSPMMSPPMWFYYNLAPMEFFSQDAASLIKR